MISARLSIRFLVGFSVAAAVAHAVALHQGEDSDLALRLDRIEARREALKHRIASLEERLGDTGLKIDSDGRIAGSRQPTLMAEDGTFEPRPVVDRMRYLERKADASVNWVKDPQFWRDVEYTCKSLVHPGDSDHALCMDGFRGRTWQVEGGSPPYGDRKCVVYDLGIREEPEFGVTLMEEYNCSIRAYDPSPTSVKWWTSKEPTPLVQKLRKAGPEKYKFHAIGAGGTDGPFVLNEYNWQQVSIFRGEDDQTARPAGTPDIAPKEFTLDGQTLSTMMKDNGDTYIDILKLDVEGSEYMYLQDILDRQGCPPVGQLALEWHHFSSDERYGAPGEINAIHSLLKACGYKVIYNRDHFRTSADFIQGARTIPPMRYNLITYSKGSSIGL